MTYRIFISSVQREFAKERKALAERIGSLLCHALEMLWIRGRVW